MSGVSELIRKIEEEIDTFRVHGKQKKKPQHPESREYLLEEENLAVTEIHTGKVQGGKAGTGDEPICYDNLAVPEIHVRK